MPLGDPIEPAIDTGQDVPADPTAQDTDSCRICRGDASPGEPLFHPCKCSGSIMYVHQDCLMEWLSHSQKKHCELCKTPFTFTKLYSPDMPASVPATVFLSRAAAHVASRVLFWARATLVAATWLFWLPWTMRFVWWGLFWLADFGWLYDVDFREGGLIQLGASNTSSQPPVRQPSLPDPAAGGVMLRLLVWAFFTGLPDDWHSMRHTTLPGNQTSKIDGDNSTHVVTHPRNTLLSSIALFQNPVLNRVAADVSEGLIITVALVAAIILVLLIREWVVQQQPIINNMAAEENAAMPNPAIPVPPVEVPMDDAEADDAVPDDAATDMAEDTPSDLDEGDGEHQERAGSALMQMMEGLDLSLLEWSTLKELCQEMRNNEEALVNYRPAHLLASPTVEQGQSRYIASTVVVKLYKTFLALEHVASNPLESLPTRVMAHEFLDKLALLNSTLQILDNGLGNQLKSRLVAAREAVGRSLSRFQARDDPPPMIQAVLDSGFDEAEASDSADTTPPRPSMPGREESFIATEIQRHLQESSLEHRGPTANAASSSNSEGSWQEVPPSAQSQPISLSEEELVRTLEEPETNLEEGHPGSEQSRSGQARQRQTFVTLNDQADEGVEDDRINFVFPQHPSRQDALPRRTPPPTEERVEVAPPKNFLMQIKDWLWGDVEPAADDHAVHEDDEHLVEDLDGEEPFFPLNQDPDDAENGAGRDAQDGPGRPGLVPNEADLIDEAEELEGVLELIGMQGPILGLFTNALFAAVFVSCTMSVAVWLPFLFGKLVLIWVAYPVSISETIFQASFSAVNIVVDFCIFSTASAASWLLRIPLNWISAWTDTSNDGLSTPMLGPVAIWIADVVSQSYTRLGREIGEAVRNTGSASSHVNLDSHAALAHIKSHASYAFNETTFAALSLRSYVFEGAPLPTVDVRSLASMTVSISKRLPHFLWAGHVTISHNASSNANSAAVISLDLPVWTALDRGLTITIGYAAVAALAAFYFSRIAPIAIGREARRIEQIVLEVLQQTGGIAKVVLIISIEMLAFPLYCGLLLDFAMLPLFSSASIESRIKFTIGSPWTSVFVHWFIGTCYMFHFALFVAMCRKILRKGVLHFIRDPDDPTFHPVRDVLERSVISQLRKIASSALIYGGLVIVCLGSVLWLLAYGISGILPIRWTSENVLFGFPVDLLLYTTLKPLLIRFLAPSDWLQDVYEWWFRRSARTLCLSHYLFGDDNEDERRTATVRSVDGAEQMVMEGKWMRVPNNDQVRVGRGQRAWTEVDEDNHRLDGWTEPLNMQGFGALDSNFTKVYIPPNFRMRITLFIASLWALTAGAGFALTVLPLLFGRSLFTLLLPRTLWANDIYAFSAGLVTICGLSFAVLRTREVNDMLSVAGIQTAIVAVWRDYGATLSNRTKRLMRCAYVYGFVALVLPSLFALLSEFYVLGPVHTWLTRGKEPHTVEMLRSWTLGVQYVRLSISAIQWVHQSTAARALRAIVARGYLDPDAGKATRYFFIPVIAAGSAALLMPTLIGSIAAISVAPDDEVKRRIVCSMTFPAILALGLSMLLMRWVVSLFRGWKLRIRDEVYLIGERLHNYGEKTAPPKVKTS